MHRRQLLLAYAVVNICLTSAAFVTKPGGSSAFLSSVVTQRTPTQLLARGKFKKQEKAAMLMNEEIQAPELRVVAASLSGGKDEALGILSLEEARAKAAEMGDLDLVLINDKATPPVCKIVDFTKFKYMKAKKAKEVLKNSKASELKEVKMSYKIDIHDYEVRKKNAAKFLKQGNRVKCTVMFRGREMQHEKMGHELLTRMSTDLGTICVREGRPKKEGRNLGLILTPKPEVAKKATESKRAQDKAKKKQKEAALKEKFAAAQAARELAAAKNPKNNVDPEDDLDVLSDVLNALAEEEDNDDNDDATLDDLLGADALTDDLFSK